MPVTNISTLRSGRSATGAPIAQPAVGSIPNYAILFWYAPTGRWDSANFGSLDNNTGAANGDYFRKYDDVCVPKAQYVDPLTGSAVALNSNPLIRCIDTDSGWKTSLGVCYSPIVVMQGKKYATRLEVGGAHKIKQFSRSSQPKGFGKLTADKAGTKLYYPLQTDHVGHDHSVVTCIDALKNIGWGELMPSVSAATGATDYQGTQHIAVNLVIRDPALPGGTKVFNKLPKNVIVFGANLPSPDYTINDDKGNGVTIGHRLPATGVSAPLLAKTIDVGLIGTDGTLTFRAVSNTGGSHTHGDIKNTSTPASDASGQTAYLFNTPPGQAPSTTNAGTGFGGHIHGVEYHNDLELKSKELRAYITALDETPIADGVIIGYSIGKYSGYRGSADGPSSLPAGWYFCDGDNGTPDLRGYFINANFRDSAHDVELFPASQTKVKDIVVELAGAHGHAGDPLQDGRFSGTDKIVGGAGSGTATDIGAHGFDASLDHDHTISPQITFTVAGVQYDNYKPNYQLQYTPPAVDIAFIQYKAV